MRLIQLNWSQKASLRDIWVKELEGENRHSFKVWEREHSRSKGPGARLCRAKASVAAVR